MAATPRDVLARDHASALELLRRVGAARTRRILERAQRDLERRLHEAIAGPGAGSYTAANVRAALAQVRQAARIVQLGIRGTLLDTADEAAGRSAENLSRYLASANRAFVGVAHPLGLDLAAIVDEASSGARATVLRRLASSGTPAAGADAIPHPARAGILERYGLRTVGHFEEILQRGLIARAPWQDVVDEIASASPFLRGAPAFWAERIVRTETAGIYNRAGWEAIRSANEESGDFLKILSATFDDRTAADSYAVHGQIRRPDEPFESWYGLYHHPPNRPNDREVVVPHRMAWPIPPYLAWRSDREIAARWALEGRKGRPPPRPKMTTVPLSRIGKAAK